MRFNDGRRGGPIASCDVTLYDSETLDNKLDKEELYKTKQCFDDPSPDKLEPALGVLTRSIVDKSINGETHVTKTLHEGGT